MEENASFVPPTGSSSPAYLVGWSLFTHALLACVLLLARLSLRSRSFLFSLANEVLVTLLWCSWSLEGLLVGTLVSPWLALLSLFLRLLLLPYIARDAYINPCAVLYRHWGLPWPRLLPLLLTNTSLQLVGMALGVAYSLSVWSALGSTVSDLHGSFMSLRITAFLTVPSITGFLLELTMTFLSLVPKLLMRGGFPLTVVESAVCCYLVFLLGDFTGAFMNPIIALSFVLVCHPGSVELFRHTAVYWLAPLLATAGAVWAGNTLLRAKPHPY